MPKNGLKIEYNMEDYLRLPYKVSIQEVKDGIYHYFLATVEGEPGVISIGSTYDEAYKRISYEMMIKCNLKSSKII